jgi:uncharacterized protein (DUF433 family)
VLVENLETKHAIRARGNLDSNAFAPFNWITDSPRDRRKHLVGHLRKVSTRSLVIVIYASPQGDQFHGPPPDLYPGAWYDHGVEIIIKNRDILGRTPVFRGTPVPIQTLFDYLEGGETREDFLESFPTVSRDSAVAALEEAKHCLLARP